MTPYFIQIGLGCRAEFAQLAKQGWSGALIEVDPLSFALCYQSVQRDAALQPYLDNLHFYNLAIAGGIALRPFKAYTFDRKNHITQWSHTAIEHTPRGLYQKQNATFNVTTVSLDFLLQHIDRPVDYLAIDIEGIELEVLRCYHFKQPPACIQLEYHADTEPEIRKILEAQNYEIVDTWHTPNKNQKWGHRDAYHQSPASKVTIYGYTFTPEDRNKFEKEMAFYEYRVASHPQN